MADQILLQVLRFVVGKLRMMLILDSNFMLIVAPVCDIVDELVCT